MSKKALGDGLPGKREKRDRWGLTQKGRNEAEASEMGDGREAEEKKRNPLPEGVCAREGDCGLPCFWSSVCP